MTKSINLQLTQFRVLIFSLLFPCSLFAQSIRVLHYTETSGFDHLTRNASFAMFQQLGSQLNFSVDDDSTGFAFDNPANLQQYSLIVFSNTSGDAILDSNQRMNFENYINQGGHVLGIHSATDTYRHSTANGTNTGTWDFFPGVIGASVQQNPNHVSGTPAYNMHFFQSHPLLAGLPDPWLKAEEYYYWQNGFFDSLNNNILLKVESTIGPNGQANSYDSSRATAWYKILPGGNRVFYTSLGHAADDFTNDSLFRLLIGNAIRWTSGLNSIIEGNDDEPGDLICYPNPFVDKIHIRSSLPGSISSNRITLFDLLQRVVFIQVISADETHFDLPELSSGVYFLHIDLPDRLMVKKIIRSRN